MTDHATLGEDPDRPDVLISGALHGDEQVGPVTTIELARWLIQRYDTDEWARRLVQTRRLLLVPMTNAWGCANRRRDELNRDPNRDFPYEQKPAACMTTITARTVNELYRHHLLQLALTFHGGMQAIGFNWGSFNYYKVKPSRSPDDVAIRAMAQRLSSYAGSGHVPLNRAYPYNTMNDLVYPVHGGMEDWGYGASWDTDSVKGCEPTSFGGYPKASTQGYHTSTVRSVVFLIEASDHKTPAESELGHAEAVLHPGTLGDGHVPRNMRLSLAAIDMVAPHVQLLPPSVTLSRDGGGAACLQMQWRVWGAIKVDRTLPLVMVASRGEPRWQPAGAAQAGDGVWAKEGPQFERGAAHAPLEMTREVREGRFGACAELPANVSGTVHVAVSATVDSNWAHTPTQAYSPSRATTPQSHIANARGNVGWSHEANGRKVRGRRAWISPQLIELELRDGALSRPPRLVTASAAMLLSLAQAGSRSKKRHARRRRLAQQWPRDQSNYIAQHWLPSARGDN